MTPVVFGRTRSAKYTYICSGSLLGGDLGVSKMYQKKHDPDELNVSLPTYRTSTLDNSLQLRPTVQELQLRPRAQARRF